MSLTSGAPGKEPESFDFTEANKAEATKVIARYPAGKQASAILTLLELAQRQHGTWLPRIAIDYVADYLDMPRIKAYEVATFYSLFNLRPVGKNLIQVCTTTPCWLRGSEDIVKACEKHLGIGLGETTPDGKFTLIEVECLAACINAPMAQIGDEYYEDLTTENVKTILDEFVAGQVPKPGSQRRKYGSMADSGPTTLKTQAEAAGLPFAGKE